MAECPKRSANAATHLKKLFFDGCNLVAVGRGRPRNVSQSAGTATPQPRVGTEDATDAPPTESHGRVEQRRRMVAMRWRLEHERALNEQLLKQMGPSLRPGLLQSWVARGRRWLRLR